MTSNPGHPSRIGSYPIERELGRGGMGIVYLGRDTRLDRAVAIKVLPEEFSGDPERLARFEREARMVASLNHPNIAGIYGIEEADGRRFLALEYVEGDTLADRIARGPLPLDETLEVARQIAAGLEAAHESGIVHRDLKPGNIKLTPSGDVKILDFGLAKGGAGGEGGSASNLSHSPTMTYAGTVAGVILGTAAYMSPEQARGRPVDRRTDIWSFGCVLYECLTGRQAFAGDTVSDMIALILQGRPEWNALPANLPAGVRHLLDRCLEKDVKKRLRDIGDARLDIEELLSGSLLSPAIATAPPVTTASARVPWLVALVLAIATIGLAAFHWLAKPPTPPVARLSISRPPGADIFANTVHLAVSPDGSRIAFVAVDSTGENQLWVRPIGSSTARMIPGTEGVGVVFWSPDGSRVAFTTNEKLKKTDLEGGTPETICNVSGGSRGGAWSPDGTIVLAPAGEGPLFKVSANGGIPVQITTLDSTRHETGHRFPGFLSDGRHFLFAALPSQDQLFNIFIGSTTTSDRELLMSAAGVPVYVEPGYLLYSRNGRLVAHRFDAGKRRLIGEPVMIGDEPTPSDWLGAPSVRASQDVVAYFKQSPVPTALAWFDRTGRKIATVPVEPGFYEALSVSPDGTRAVVSRRVSSTESDLWIVELNRGSMTRFTFGPGRCDGPTWSPDGSRIAFSSDRNGTWDIYVKPVSGATPEVRLPTNRSLLTYPSGWSPDSRLLLIKQLSEKTSWDLWTIPVDGDQQTQTPYIQTPFSEFAAGFSPDGRWVCYDSDESGANEVYVQAFPTPGLKHKVSNGGGSFPWWRADGREIAYVDGAGNGVFVAVSTDGEFSAGTPVTVQFPSGIQAGWQTPDFQRILLSIVDEKHRIPAEITVLLNWQGELGRR